MKICPKCQNKYTDDSLQFCLQDGTLLTGEATGISNSETAAIDEPETVIAKTRREKVNVEIAAPVERTPPDTNPSYERVVEPTGSNTFLTILLTAIGMLLFFSIVAGGIWFYLNWGSTTNSRGGLATSNGNVAQKPTPTGMPSPTVSLTPTPEKTKTPTPKPTALPPDAKEKIEKEVLATIFGWKTAAEARNLGAYMKNYSNNVNYYRKRGASRAFVEKDKRKAFEKYDTIKSTFSNIAVVPSKNGERATVTFDKEWNFSGPQSSTSGKVRSQLILKKSGARWLIESERDLKVYYVNK
ncbi:MAG: hypothetical protein HKN25_07090 [Pyrinomonadaceae bacterium]|nr:hypothetical protein [Pyrinomonadaceae bacterium]